MGSIIYNNNIYCIDGNILLYKEINMKKLGLLIGIVLVFFSFSTVEAACDDCFVGDTKCAGDLIMTCKNIYSNGVCYDWDTQSSIYNFCENGCTDVYNGLAICNGDDQQCNHECASGEGRCEFNTVVPCINDPITGCRVWSSNPFDQDICVEPQVCNDDGFSAFCQAEDPDFSCTNECIIGETRCGNPPGITGSVKYKMTCGYWDDDSCTEYPNNAQVSSISGFEWCDFGCTDITSGISVCNDEPIVCPESCVLNSTICDASSGAILKCKDYNNDGCNEYINPSGDTDVEKICPNGCELVSSIFSDCRSTDVNLEQIIYLENIWKDPSYSGFDIFNDEIYTVSTFKDSGERSNMVVFDLFGNFKRNFSLSFPSSFNNAWDTYVDNNILAIQSGRSTVSNQNATAVFNSTGFFLGTANISGKNDPFGNYIDKDTISGEYWVFSGSNAFLSNAEDEFVIVDGNLELSIIITDPFNQSAIPHYVRGIEYDNGDLWVLYAVGDANDVNDPILKQNVKLVQYSISNINRSQMEILAEINITDKLGPAFYKDIDLYNNEFYFLANELSDNGLIFGNISLYDKIFKASLDDLISESRCDASALFDPKYGILGLVDSKCSGTYPNTNIILCADDNGDGKFEWSQKPWNIIPCVGDTACAFNQTRQSAECRAVNPIADGVCEFSTAFSCQIGSTKCIADQFQQNCIGAIEDPDCGVWNTSYFTCGGPGSCLNGKCSVCVKECEIGSSKCVNVPIAESPGGGVITSTFITPCKEVKGLFGFNCTVWADIDDTEVSISECQYGCKLKWNETYNDTYAQCIVPDGVILGLRNGLESYKANLNIILEAPNFKMMFVFLLGLLAVFGGYLFTGSTEIGMFSGVVVLMAGIVFGWVPIEITVLLVIFAGFMLLRWFFSEGD